ncbi:carbonic anhydrase 15 isoform X3 [Clarias gariepinus]|uniref:carbonic anhydrase 15 isoform X3 n=1 Tax=Clarias gariepinus TaxID=13013 RepID=UPI00234CE248|nr:carbonic anhydrase 15 isoform X3 [Clarias gariepinus]
MSSLPALISFLTLSALSASPLKVPHLNYCYTEDACNPYNWVKQFSNCITTESTLQSPIELKPVGIKNDSISSLQLRGFSVPQKSWTVMNLGDTVVVKFQAGMTVKGGSINHDYRIVEMRFHWGSNTTNGSEHKFDKRRFPMEITSDENKAFKAISHAVANVPYPGDSMKVTPPALSNLLPDNYTFYQYQGGQTTPPCRQTVTWIVFEKPIFISRQQLLPFITQVYHSDKNDTVKKQLVNNYRFIQPTLNRQIFVSSARNAALSQHALFIPVLFITSKLSLMIP